MMKKIWPFQRLQVNGKSMMPNFREGDRILIFRWGRVRENDVIVFQKNGLMMLKRAVKKEDGHWIVRGDNFAESTDSLDFGKIPESRIIGKAVYKY